MKLGQLIKKRRTERNLRLVDLAAVIGKHAPYISLIENDREIPSSETLNDICDALDMDNEFMALYAVEEKIQQYSRLIHKRYGISLEHSS